MQPCRYTYYEHSTVFSNSLPTHVLCIAHTTHLWLRQSHIDPRVWHTQVSTTQRVVLVVEQCTRNVTVVRSSIAPTMYTVQACTMRVTYYMTYL